MICHVDCPVTTDRESVEMGGAVFKILHTPGHSIAHVCITTPDDVAYVGDALISHGVMRGAKMPYACVLSEDLKSKEKLRGLVCSHYVLAHRGIYDNISELVEDNIEFYKLRAEKILALLVRPMTLQELAQETVANFHIGMGSVFKYNLIERMLRSYLEYLTETGRIALSVNDSVLRYTRL
jgi:glyoxylase-like metal-dependent hydrolase (beta-lactamase superfamily II)